MSRITLVEYDPLWPSLFDEQARFITALLSPFVREIHHIGSTAIPGLAAKPKIDIDAVITDPGALPELSARLSKAGYACHGDPHANGLRTFTAATFPYGTRLYLCRDDNATHAERMLFRDALRENPDLARRYETLKRQLASEAEGDWDIYTNGKRGFIAAVLATCSTKKAPPSPAGPSY
ncbi:GrpB family protein [Ensifer sp. PDNC004]|uniref:GrpB family protein n=1 Tax=Ensifer sp. PDNC004 TaxID=2811423 RepID=UPI0019658B64|nr:GrpB family protein [Ensifer sp. PDNC004]QRY69526.1 GrpB family protein [Ensifer sp. PDNC004]